MTNEHKDALTGLCKVEIKRWKVASESNPNMRYMVELMEVALAALTAPPDEWQQRAEAAEAKLAELENQRAASPTVDDLDVVAGCYYRKRQVDALLASRPAPAINLAELVPDEMPTSHIYHGGSGAFNDGKESGWNACRAAILRNIEEAK